MKLVLMSTPYFFVEEHQILTALFDEGLEMVHLNKPNSEPVFCERLLSLLPKEYRKLIVTHDHFYLQNEFELKGIHLDRFDETIPYRNKGSLSCTCQSLEELASVKKEMDYVLLDVTQEDVSADVQQIYKEASKRKVIDKRVFACGALDQEQISKIAECGFGGVVVGEEIWNHFDVQNTQDFRELINNFRKLQRLIN
jgi:thiamine-phosphate pyrophosphorylase